MLYLFHGSDTQASRKKLHKKLDVALSKNPDSPLMWIDEENFDGASFPELLGGQSLFGGVLNVAVDASGGEGILTDFISEKVRDIKESENVFYILFGKETKKTLEPFLKYAQSSEESALKEVAAQKFNVFSLTDALGKRDRKGLWVLYQKAKRNNIADEEVHGILFWQLKCMLFAASSASANDAGIKEFPFKKAKSFLRNFREGEVEEKAHELLLVTYDARRGKSDFGGALERFILSV
ncbi:MAG: hypothetical protein WDZ90_02745 [Candidatus Paceibacterota bacterium]